jgi:hypothetical protein
MHIHLLSCHIILHVPNFLSLTFPTTTIPPQPVTAISLKVNHTINIHKIYRFQTHPIFQKVYSSAKIFRKNLPMDILSRFRPILLFLSLRNRLNLSLNLYSFLCEEKLTKLLKIYQRKSYPKSEINVFTVEIGIIITENNLKKQNDAR